jgi:MFS family permease
MPFSLYLVIFAITMAVLSGELIDKFGIRYSAVIGCILLGLGWFFSSMVTTPTMLVISYGLIGGIGSGITYGVTLTIVNQWFPDRQGFAVGIAVFGNGISALVTANLAGYLIETHGITSMFRIFGIAIILITVSLAFFLSSPPEGWKPEKGSPSVSGTPNYVKDKCTRSDMVKTPIFYGLWICYLIGSICGLMAVSISQPFGTESVFIDAGLATILVSIFAISNAIGRPFFGYLADKLNPRNIAMIMFFLITLASIAIGYSPTTLVYCFAFIIFWLCLGGWVAFAPAATSYYFGNYDYTRCNGIIMLAYGIGGFIGPQLAGFIRTSSGNYLGIFPYVFLLAIIGFFVALILLKQQNERSLFGFLSGPPH